MSETTKKLTFGQWIQIESGGVMGLSTKGSLALLALAILSVIIMMVFGPLWAIAIAGVGGGGLLGLSIRDKHGDNFWERTGRKQEFNQFKKTGHTLYRSGPLGVQKTPSFALPGVLGTTKAHRFKDAFNRDLVVIEYPTTNDWALVLRVEPDGNSGVDQEVVDAWVGEWGDWLANLSEESGVVGASVIVESSPETGHRLQSEVAKRISPDASEFSRNAVNDSVTFLSQGRPKLQFFVTVTWSGSELADSKDPHEIGIEIATRTPGLTEALKHTGAGFASPLSAGRLAEYLRVAWDPAVAGLIDEAQVYAPNEETVKWEDAGPVAYESEWEWLRHDSALSTSWQMTYPPRGLVQSTILSRLLSPTANVERKRVALLYTPAPAGEENGTAEKISKAATFNATSKRRTTAADAYKVNAALKLDQELMEGAGLTEFAIVMTATLSDPTQLKKAQASARKAWQGSRLRMRPAYGSQVEAFATTLPLGVVPHRHLTPPKTIRVKTK